ncbi:hypothetical protein D6817_05895 [Candidatus Pacearchaeota archaeon]|nr:MAG: hypothetical protein D6817_05895 [Candidatus Pacearchaeota archaeon]
MNWAGRGVLILSFTLLLFILLWSEARATPSTPTISVISNETKSAGTGAILNISGGYISTINISATVQNPRWKAFVGNVTGKFTLDDASGSTIYDWSTTVTSGEIYATRNSSTIDWTNITCATTANLETENNNMGHTNPDDNITATFSDTTHQEFFVGSINISQNSCPTLNTYVNSASQDTSFEEVALYEAKGGNVIYATIMENDVTGFDGQTYDFQMIVPEVGTPGFDGATAYYLYVELS